MTVLDARIDAYLESLRARQYSPNTLTAYAEDLRQLGAFVGATDPAALGGHDIRRALASLHGRGYAPKSLARMLSAWRSLFRHLAREGQVAANPCTGIRPPKASKRLPHTLSPDELACLLDAGGDDPWQVRDRAMFELMYSSGLRLAELVGLTPDAIDRQVGEVRVTGKGRKERIVPVGGKALEALAAWLAVRPALKGEAGALFIGARGARISPRVVQYRLKQLALRQGISQRVHPHALRHSFASHVLQSSGDLRAVQEMLGHASLSTTQVYTHLDYQHLAKVYDAAHPRAKKK
ncbi:MAG: tyrosine recombinase XerC [Hydrogenophilales bacterium]|nr:tyrosine recombinase XerC [Hydrogenophilales bacterium]